MPPNLVFSMPGWRCYENLHRPSSRRGRKLFSPLEVNRLKHRWFKEHFFPDLSLLSLRLLPVHLLRTQEQATSSNHPFSRSSLNKKAPLFIATNLIKKNNIYIYTCYQTLSQLTTSCSIDLSILHQLDQGSLY